MADQFQHLNAVERCRLITILSEFEYLFDSTLGTWNTTLVYLELKDYAKTVFSRPYTVPRVKKVMFRN